MVSKAALAAALAMLVGALPAAAPLARAATPPPPAPKVVIVVGPTEGTTASYRADADSIAAAALKYTPNVVKVYSPNATWAAVSAAAQGASIFVDLGHGWGFPSPYTTTLTPNSEDGMALNAAANQGDSNRQYYGESVIASGIRFAPNAVVFLNHLCYAPGASEPGNAVPSQAVAQQRVDNFASGYIRAGARAVVADDGIGTVEAAITSIFTSHQSMLSAWRSMPDAAGPEIGWTPTRNPAFQAAMDPDATSLVYTRSIVTDPGLQTGDVVAGAAEVPQAPTLMVPGAASVGSSPAALFTDQTLATVTGASIAAGTTVRVDQVVAQPPAGDGSTPPPAVQVHTLDDATTGWVSGAGLVALNSTGPQLWSVTGPTTVSPNGDGIDDSLALWLRLSEAATWTATILDPGGNVMTTMSGSSDLFALSWSALVDSEQAPAGTYQWQLAAQDAMGNPPLQTKGTFTVVNLPPPPAAVVSFSATQGAMTNSALLTYGLTFNRAVSGLAAASFTLAGTATGCTVGNPTGSGPSWTVEIAGCSTGTVALTLQSGAALDGSAEAAPAAAVTAPTVVIDRTSPTTSVPATSQVAGGILGSSPAARVIWTAADVGGSGVATYDVERSIDGGPLTLLLSGLGLPAVSVNFAPGHTYRFAVRAHDRAGNVGSWVAGGLTAASVRESASSAITFGAGWRTLTAAAYSGGSTRYSTTAGATAQFTFTGRSIALVSTLASSHGQARIYVDGAYVTTVDTRSSTTRYRAIVWTRNWGSTATHTVKVVVVGTTARPRVDMDAFVVMS